MTGIFGYLTDEVFARYHVKLQFRDRVVGGIPSNRQLIEGWLRSKLGITREQELQEIAVQTLKELGIETELLGDGESGTVASYKSISAAADAIAKKSNTCMFKRDASGLYLEQRAIKAMLKESAAVQFPGAVAQKGAGTYKWGPTGKAPRGGVAEWVFIEPSRVPLGVVKATDIDLSIGHITGPQGPRSTLDYYEYVERAIIEFDLMVLENRVPIEKWPYLWRYAEENGLGAKRSQGFGQFDVLAWDPLNDMARKALEQFHADRERFRRSGQGNGVGPARRGDRVRQPTGSRAPDRRPPARVDGPRDGRRLAGDAARGPAWHPRRDRRSA